MGNFSSKDGHGPPGAHLDIFHTPPTSPDTDLPAAPQLIPLSAEQSQTPTLTPTAVTASIPASVPVPTGKKPQPSITPTTPTPTPDWKPTPPVTPNNPVIGPAVSSSPAKPGSGSVTLKGPVGRNGGPSSSTPKTPVSQGKSAVLSPIKSPSSSLGSASPVASPAGPRWRERDSGLSQSPLPSHGARDGQGEEMERVVEECKTTLGIGGQDGALNTTDLLKRLLTEVKNLRNTLQTERGEWLQFQADLQVAVAVADRLRAEAEEELTALRTAHKDVERELVAAQQRQKEADGQLVTLRGELRESRQRQATLAQAPAKIEVQAPNQARQRPGAETNSSDLGGETRRGREGGTERASRNEETKRNAVAEEARTDAKGVAKRYLRNVTNEERGREDGQTNETARRTVTTERSRSLSRLPVSSDPPAVHNGTSQSKTATTAGSTNKNPGQPQGRRSLDRQDSWSSTQTGKREETLNKYNTALTELPPSKSQDGFNLLLRRHGGSKRNSLLRWCQSRTQGYKNIDITNFSSSWADGLAFCAVYHTYLPSHIPYCTLSPESKRENLSLAFKTGENVGITQSLTVEEMLRAGGPDWQRVLGYVESMYRHFEM